MTDVLRGLGGLPRPTRADARTPPGVAPVGIRFLYREKEKIRGSERGSKETEPAGPEEGGASPGTLGSLAPPSSTRRPGRAPAQ